MMRLRKWALLTSGLILAAAAWAAPTRSGTGAASVNLPVGQLRFYQTADGLTFANAWGDPTKGPHSNFIKLPGDTASPLHIHTSSYYGVVISGVVSNERRGDPDRPLAAGSYWFQLGGEPHTTTCLSHVDCLIFVTSQGRFDMRPVVVTAPAGQPAGQRP